MGLRVCLHAMAQNKNTMSERKMVYLAKPIFRVRDQTVLTPSFPIPRKRCPGFGRVYGLRIKFVRVQGPRINDGMQSSS